MTATNRIFLDESFAYLFDDSLTNVNTLQLNPLEYMEIYAYGTNQISITLQNVELPEVAENLIDDLGSVGGWAVLANSQTIVIILDKTIDTEQKAIDYITGLLCVYQVKNLSYYSTNLYPQYTLKTISSSNVLIGQSVASSLTELTNRILSLDNNLNPSAGQGWYNHIIRRNLVVLE